MTTIRIGILTEDLPGTNLGINLDTKQGKYTGTSTTLELPIESSQEVTQGTNQGAATGTSINKEMTTGTNTETTIGITKETLLETSPGKILETSLRTFIGETFIGVTIPETPQGETQETTLGTSPGTGMKVEDRMKGATALGEIEVMMIGEGMPAMGADVERVARSP